MTITIILTTIGAITVYTLLWKMCLYFFKDVGEPFTMFEEILMLILVPITLMVSFYVSLYYLTYPIWKPIVLFNNSLEEIKILQKEIKKLKRTQKNSKANKK